MAKIIDGFDMAALRKSRVQNTNKTDLVAALREISPEIEQLKVGQTVEIPTTKVNLRKTVMQITAKLNHLTCQGGQWAGKSYDVASDSESKVYVQRNKQLKADEIPVRKKGGGGGRPRKNAAPAGANGSGAGVIEHA